MFDLSRKSRNPIAQWWWTVDKGIIFCILILMGIGGMLSLAATPTLALRLNLPPYYFSIRHALFFVPCLAVMLWLSLLSPQKIRLLSLRAFPLLLLAMIACLVVGPSIKGAHRWIQILGFTFQPSELIKPTFVILVAQVLAAKENGWGKYAVALLIYAAVTLVLFLQPDFGQMMLITGTLFVLLFVSQAPLALLVSMGGASLALGALSYTLLPHVARRVNSFLSPKHYDTYQTDKAIQAFSLGGLFGQGPGEGVVKKILPDAHTDFIFSVAVEEYGGIFAVVLISIFCLLTLKSLAHALREEQVFLRVAICGLTSLFAMQTCINIAVNVHMIPTKGMTLPFISYGGSSMFSISITVGMLLALTRKDAGLLRR